MMSLFDEEEVIRSYIKSERYEAEQDKAKKTAIRMIKAGKISLRLLDALVKAHGNSKI